MKSVQDLPVGSSEGRNRSASRIAPARAVRHCARCGREGRNAFRPVGAAVGATMWVCTHEGPCVERTRMLRRAAARAAQGRPPQSPIAGYSWDARRACVIGSDPASRQAITAVLADLGSIDVESLDLTRRSIEMLGRRDFGLIMADVRAGDAIALLGMLARRLAGAGRRGVPIVVAHDPGDGNLPAIAALMREAGGTRLTRPIEPMTLLAKLDELAGASTAGTEGRAAS